MPTYNKLTNDEKTAIKDSVVRNLEYQMYSLQLEMLAENAKTTPDVERIEVIQSNINDKLAQIAAVEAE
ncbi:MAG: hypothetical protein EBW76_08180 [Actinobacteria bacterium]|jgi:hypothetical protein|nr:hypothetical protein [Actinomycetota bacterium]